MLELEPYYHRLRGDDPIDAERAQDELIVLLTPRAKQHVHKFLRSPGGEHYYYLKDDLQAEALQALVKAVHRLRTHPVQPEPAKLLGWLSRLIIRAVHSFAHEDAAVRVPHTTWRRRIRESKTQGGGEPSECDTQLPTTVSIESIPEPTYDAPFAFVDEWDEILFAAKSPIEKRVVQLKFEGYTSAEIADEIGYSVTGVYDLLRRVYTRLEAQTLEREYAD